MDKLKKMFKILALKMNDKQQGLKEEIKQSQENLKEVLNQRMNQTTV